MDPLFEKFMPEKSGQPTSTAIDPTFQKFGLSEADTSEKKDKPLDFEGPSFTSTVKKIGRAIGQGTLDTIDTGASAIGYIDSALSKSGEERNTQFKQRLSKELSDFESNPENQGIATDVGRVIGQVASTAPLVPARLMQGAAMVSRALPTVLSTGEKIAAPLVNRIAGLGLQGGIAGGITQGATTASRPQTSLPVDLATGIGTGIVAGPMAHGAVVAASKLPVAARSLWASANISKLANEIEISPSAAKNIIARLDEAGITPTDAAAMVQKMGPKATLADIDESLITEASGLASRGGKSTALLKNTYADRAATADSSAKQIIETKLGSKPDIQVEKSNIIDEARKLTGADYRAAHKSATPVDVSGVASNIDDSLQTAVGSKAKELNTAKGYLYDSNGNLKTDVKSLHEVRQALDDTLERLPKEGTSQKSSTYRAVEDVRKQVDVELKKIPEMKRADQIFTEKSGIAKGIDYGYQAFNKGTREEFEKIWTAATPEIKDTIRKGMTAAAHDALETAQRGEMAGAQRMFGKKSVNREKLRMAFGVNADSVLNELQKEASFRATENLVNRGAQTAERQAVQRRYGDDGKGSGNFIRDTVLGASIDVASGASGGATAMMAARNIGSGARQRFLSVGADNMAEGSADLLSRQGVMRDKAIDALDRIKEVRDRNISSSKAVTSRLPVISGAPLIEQLKKKFDKL